MKTEKLLASYREAAIRNYEGSWGGDARKANRACDRLMKIAHTVRTGSPELQQAFLTLLEDEAASVRSWAARDALEFAPEKALATLRKLAAESSFPTSFSAEMVLKAWEDGTLPRP